MTRGYSFIIIWVHLIIIASTTEFNEEDFVDGDTTTAAPDQTESIAIDGKYQEKVNQDNRGDFVFEHNVVRSSTEPVAIDMVFMVWAYRLEKIAKLAVSDCAFKDALNDIEMKDLRYWFSSGGLNSWYAKAQESIDVSAIVETWATEKSYFDFEHLGCELGRKCMRYAQIVWATASHVGCALKFCKKFTDQAMNPLTSIHYVICVYGEGESKLTLEGEYKHPYRGGNESCKRCPTGFSDCTNGLCDTKPRCETVVDCSKISISELCLCDESVYSRGQRRLVAPLWTALQGTVVMWIIFTASSGCDFS